MAPKTIQDVLPLVDHPSRYLGTEVNRQRKDLAQIPLKMVLAFPDLYEIGMSHFGMQILYHILNGHPQVAAERVFAPSGDMESQMRAQGLPLVSLESHHPVDHFDMIGFSLLYELNYTNMLMMLDLAGIPFRASQRRDSHPVVIAGGPCVSNPEPIADFFDAIVIGDGENVVLDMAEAWLAMQKSDGRTKTALLEAWSRLDGVYVPSFYRVDYDARHRQTIRIKDDASASGTGRVKRAIVGDLNLAPFPEKPLVPYGKPIHDRLRLEISRGCTRGCRFCQAGMLYRPVRERSLGDLLNLSRSGLEKTGYEDLSLLSLSTSDYSCIAPLIHALMHHFSSDHVSVSLPSFRAGTLGPDLMRAIRKVRKTGFTIAPEAGSQRLRDVINKNITTEEIVATVQDAFSAGWQVIKLYFMVGLPTETHADIQAIVDLVKKLRKLKTAQGRYGKLNVSVATFIPKPHTPFQWANQLSLDVSRERIEWLRSKLRLPGIQFKWQNPEVSFLEGLWARGDRRLSDLLEIAYRNGCRFDGWSDRFDFKTWQRSIEQSGIDLDFYMGRARDLTEALPWDHIDTRVQKTFLIQEWQRAFNGDRTEDCRWEGCQKCGCCDFENVAPILSGALTPCCPQPPDPPEASLNQPQKLRLYYSKRGDARFFGHLELANIVIRAFRRAGVHLVYSKGFHPMPKVSFGDALPIGMEALNESLVISTTDKISCAEVMRRMNLELPEGLSTHACEEVTGKDVQRTAHVDDYRVLLKEGVFDERRLQRFNKRERCDLTYTTKKGESRSIDLKSAVLSIDLISPRSIRLSIQDNGGKRIRPAMVLKRVFSLSAENVRQAIITKGNSHV